VIKLSVVGERFRSRLWPIPATGAVLAGVAAALLSTVRPEPQAESVFWPGEPSSARSLLEVLAGTSLTVVALVFSLFLVALQLAASQYSPRLLRTFSRDPWVQASLAVLISTFVFSLVTLALFGTVDRPPRISVAVATALGLAGVGALVGAVAHIVSSLRVETVMNETHEDAARVIHAARDSAELAPRPADWPPAGSPGTDARQLSAPRSGFVQAVARPRLVSWAQRHTAYVQLDVTPGDHVLDGRPLGRVWFADRGPGDDAADAPNVDEITSAVMIGYERTPDEDPAFGVVQLVDVAARALSPSMNDPTTAVHAIGHVAALLGQVATSDRGAFRLSRGKDGTVRLVERQRTMTEYLATACRPLVRAGANHPQVLLALIDLLDYVRTGAPDASAAVDAELAYLVRGAEHGLTDETDRETVRAAVDRVTDPR
jgi:uncharacterized membrane protein